jgi:hypothetical protein
VLDPFSNGTFGPLAFADWPHHRLRILSRRCFLSFCHAFTYRRRWFEHHPRSSSLPLAFWRPLNIPNPNRQGVLDRFAVISATQPFSRRSAWIATSHRGPWLLMPLQAPSDCSRSSPV